MTENINHQKNQSKKAKSSFHGCLLLMLSPFILIFLFFFILSLVAIPEFPKVQSKARASAVKNVLINGLKECLDRETKKESDLSLNSVESFSNTNVSEGYKIQAIGQNSCFRARAIPLNTKDAWFEAELDRETKEITKKCGDSTKYGCEEGNTW